MDDSYGVHWDSKGHTGMMMPLGRGAAMSFSYRHKLYAQSSTEAELIGIYDALPCIMRGLYFIEAQGYELTHNILYQDNKSTILLARNGRWSSSKRTKHINNRYFLVKDEIDRGEVEVQHCGTKDMWSDVLTKPLQMRVYCEMHSNLMNCPVDYVDDAERRATHLDLLPKEGWSADPEEQAGNSEDLKKAVQLMMLIQRGTTPPNHRRSVLEDVQRARRAVHNARPAGQKASPRTGKPLRHVTARAAGGGKPAGGRRRSTESVHRNKYVPALLLVRRLAGHARAS